MASAVWGWHFVRSRLSAVRGLWNGIGSRGLFRGKPGTDKSLRCRDNKQPQLKEAWEKDASLTCDACFLSIATVDGKVIWEYRFDVEAYVIVGSMND